MSRFTIKATHRTGLEVTFQQGCDPMQNAHEIDTMADLIISAGFKPAAAVATASAPVAGEERERISHVLRGKHVKDGKTTPTILLYAENKALKHSVLKVYLNQPEDVAAFETACGAKLDSFPVYIGKDKPERGVDPDLDAYIVATKPFVAVYKPNSRWSEAAANEARSRGEVYAIPRRVFVRWESSDGQQPARTTPQPAPAHQAAPAATPWPQRMERIRAFIATKPNLEAFNRKLFGPEFNWDSVPADGRGELESTLDNYAAGVCGWKYDRVAGRFTDGVVNEVPF